MLLKGLCHKSDINTARENIGSRFLFVFSWILAGVMIAVSFAEILVKANNARIAVLIHDTIPNGRDGVKI